MADKIVVCGFGGPDGASVFIDWESGVEVEAGPDGVSIKIADKEVWGQVASVVEGLVE